MEPVTATAATAPAIPDPTAVAPAAQQVAAVLADIGRSAAPDASSSGTAATGAAGTASSAAAAASQGGVSTPGNKDIVIQLDPEHLGTVSIRMRMSGDKVDIQIHVENSQTLDILSRDRHVLSAAVEAAGGDGSTFSLGGPASSAQDGAMGQSGQPASGGQSSPNNQQQGAFAASSFSSGDRAGQGEDQPSGQPNRGTAPDGDASATAVGIRRDADNSLYV